MRDGKSISNTSRQNEVLVHETAARGSEWSIYIFIYFSFLCPFTVLGIKDGKGKTKEEGQLSNSLAVC
jgi:hypothetical protein